MPRGTWDTSDKEMILLSERATVRSYRAKIVDIFLQRILECQASQLVAAVALALLSEHTSVHDKHNWVPQALNVFITHDIRYT